jgi:hypothetical protein
MMHADRAMRQRIINNSTSHMKTIFFILALFVLPVFAIANGGDQRVLGQEYLINLSKSPFTPIAGTKTAMTVSFVDLKTRAPIKEDILVRVHITKGRGSMVSIFEQKDIIVRGGVLDLSYTFAESGLHEVFFDFAYVSAPEVVYEPPDFLMDIQPAPPKKQSPIDGILWAGIGAVLGLTIGFALGRKGEITRI